MILQAFDVVIKFGLTISWEIVISHDLLIEC